MTDQHNDGGPAFPQNDLSTYNMGPAEKNNGGMTLRDWFAGHAPPMPEDWYAVPFIGDPPSGTIFPYAGPRIAPSELVELDMDARRDALRWQAKAIASWRFVYADAMLAAREASE